MNGDVLTDARLRRALPTSTARPATCSTIASHRRVVRTDYGVLHVDGGRREVKRVVGFEEKPELAYVVSMGVYVLEPRRRSTIVPADEPSTSRTW